MAPVTKIRPPRPIQSTHLEYVGLGEPDHRPGPWTRPVAELLAGHRPDTVYPSAATALRNADLDAQRRESLARLAVAIESSDPAQLTAEVQFAYDAVLQALGLRGRPVEPATYVDWRVA